MSIILLLKLTTNIFLNTRISLDLFLRITFTRSFIHNYVQFEYSFVLLWKHRSVNNIKAVPPFRKLFGSKRKMTFMWSTILIIVNTIRFRSFCILFESNMIQTFGVGYYIAHCKWNTLFQEQHFCFGIQNRIGLFWYWVTQRQCEL